MFLQPYCYIYQRSYKEWLSYLYNLTNAIYLVGKDGFEPPLERPKRPVLPLDDFPKWWKGLDSNQRTPKRGDLQSPAIAAMRPFHKREV